MINYRFTIREMTFLCNPFVALNPISKQDIEKEKRKKGDTIPYVGKHRTPKRKYPLPR